MFFQFLIYICLIRNKKTTNFGKKIYIILRILKGAIWNLVYKCQIYNYIYRQKLRKFPMPLAIFSHFYFKILTKIAVFWEKIYIILRILKRAIWNLAYKCQIYNYIYRQKWRKFPMTLAIFSHFYFKILTKIAVFLE